MLDITVVLAIAAIVLYFCLRMNIPPIVAFLVAGMVAGPHGLGLVGSPLQVENIAHVGVLLLLFTIGIEFSLEKLISSQRYVLLGGTFQMALTILAFFGISLLLGNPWNQALFIGFLFCLSSTAIVLQLFQDSNQLESFHGKVSISILIFQDIAIVPLMLVLPWLSGKKFLAHDFLDLLGGVIVVTVVILASRRFIPRLISKVVHTRNRELFLLFIIVVCFVTAFITYKVGLSLALGAFLAGMVISESEFSFEAMTNILPLKKIFTSIFFISVGMLLNIGFLLNHPLEVLSMSASVMLVKILIVLLVGLLLKLPKRSVWITALALCQVGEFAFVLAGQGSGLLSEHLYQLFLSVSVISMGLSPFIIQSAPKVAAKFSAASVAEESKGAKNSFHSQGVHLSDHLVIIGYGMNGRNVARAAKAADIPYVIIDFNPDTYRKEKLKRECFIYGDASSQDVLMRANIQQARIAVVAIHDPIATEMIVFAIRSLNPKVRLIVRTRFMHEIDVLRKLGADEVIPEEFETSIEIFIRVMKYYLVPDSDIEKFVDDIRKENYEMLRRLASGGRDGQDIPFLSVLNVAKLKIPEDSKWVGRSLEEIMLRKKYGVTVIGIQREREYIHNPTAATVLVADDVLIVIGLPEDIAKVSPFVQEVK
ncbi:MAG TPA: cation:proton antiporter [Chitinophagales bacterium]|nr:cation:proton antiporter [Chitinophagales bacterium]